MTKYKNIGLTLLVMLLWGSLFPMVKLGYSAYNIKSLGDILLFAGIRFTICGLIISLFAFFIIKNSFKSVKNTLLPILLSGVFAIILHYGFTYTGLMLSDSSKTAIIKQIGALIYICFSFVFFKEDRPSAVKIIGALLGFCGIVAINFSGGELNFNLGDFLIIAASFCTVFSNVISKKALGNVSAVSLTGISQLFGGVVLVVAGVLLGGQMNFDVSKWYILFYICVASILSYCIWFSVVKKGELSKLFIIKFAEPIFACLFGAVILGENILKPQYLVALLLIFGGIALSNKR